jgi:tRNA G37 N-methylase TrmD
MILPSRLMLFFVFTISIAPVLAQGRFEGIRDGNEILTFQIYAIGQRVYILAAGEKQAQTLSEAAINFFNSFRLLQ